MTHVGGASERERKQRLQSSHYKCVLQSLVSSSLKNAFLIGEINFEKKFNTFENDTHEGRRKRRSDEKKQKFNWRTRDDEVKKENFFGPIIKSENPQIISIVLGKNVELFWHHISFYSTTIIVVNWLRSSGNWTEESSSCRRLYSNDTWK
jgi:hypothetical protein